MKLLRVVVGLAFWLGLGAAIWLRVAAPTGAEAASRAWAGELLRFWTSPRVTVELRLPAPTEVAVGDPIFTSDGSGALTQVGELVLLTRDGQALSDTAAASTVPQAMLYPIAPRLSADASLTLYTTPDSIVWVVNTLLTTERRDQITQELRLAINAHQDEILATLKPLVEKTLTDAVQVIEQDLPGAIRRRRGELESLGAKYQREIVEKELLPLVKSELWPLVRRRAEPLANEVGREMWERVSVWRFAWRAAYDRSVLLPEKKLVEQEMQRFVKKEAMPILERHTDDFTALLKEVLQEASHNEAVKAGVRRSFAHLASDPELRRFVWDVVDEVMIDNPRLREALERNWTSPEAAAALQFAGERLEPTVRRIAELVFGTFHDGITPEFAQVLRTQILAKDRRWFLLDAGTPSAGPAVASSPIVLPVKLGGGAAARRLATLPASARQ
jgi:hypothetical protein